MNKLFLLLFVIILYACSPSGQEAESVNEATLSGTITNPKNDNITLTFDGKKEVAKLDENGNFQITVQLNEPRKYLFTHEEYATVYLSPGDELKMNLNVDQFDETLKFTGTGSAVNNYIVQNYLEREKVSHQEFYSLEEADFIAKAKSIFDDRKEKLEKLKQLDSTIDPDFIKDEEVEILYDWAIKRLDYPGWYKQYNNNKEVVLSDNYHDYLKEVNLNDETLITKSRYKNFLSNYLHNKARKLVDKKIPEDSDEYIFNLLKHKLNLTKNVFANTKIQNQILYKEISNNLDFGGKAVGDNIDLFRAKCTNKEYVEKVNKSFKKWEAISAGKKAPGFKCTDASGKDYALEDFKGQYLYIDVWATWCGPCIGELPYLEDIAKEYKDKNIAFVSISIDSSEDPWKSMLKKKNMKGYQLYTPNAWESDLAKNYLISYIPRFILIDKEGNIIDSQAERPSGDLKKVLEKLDIEKKTS